MVESFPTINLIDIYSLLKFIHCQKPAEQLEII